MKMSNHRLPVFLTIKHRPLAWLYSTVVMRFRRKKKNVHDDGTQFFEKKTNRSRALRPKEADASFVFDLKFWVLTHRSFSVNVREMGPKIQNVVESLGTLLLCIVGL